MQTTVTITERQVESLLREMRARSKELTAIRESLHEVISAFHEMSSHINHPDRTDSIFRL